MIETSKIRMDGGTQSRAQINEQTVADYAEAMQDENTVFPPIVVYYDGSDYWLADGFHRVYAWLRRGWREVPAEIRQGDRRAAVLHSCAANAAHGLRRTNDDKRRAVMTLLEDAEWSAWSDREIARRCGVSHPFVAALREGLTGNVTSEDSPRTYTTKHGTEAQMDTSRIGKADSIPSETEGATTVEPEKQGGGSHGSRQPQADADVTRADDQAPEAGEQESAAAGESPAPEPAPRPDPYGYAKLTEAALLDTANGLRADLDDAKKRIREQTHQIADLKAQVKNHTDDKDEVIRRLTKEAKDAKNAKFRAEEDLTAWKRQVHGLKKDVARLEKSLASQEIPL